METIHVPISELRVGKVISEDIFANTQYPIIFKNTIISHEHLQVFFAFNISRVSVYKDGTDHQSEVNDTELVAPPEAVPTFKRFMIILLNNLKRNLKIGKLVQKLILPKHVQLFCR